MSQKLLYSSPVYMYDHILDGPSQQNDKFQFFKTEVSGNLDQNPNMKDIDDLGKFSQIVCELHNLHQLSWLDEYPTIERVLKKTKKTFTSYTFMPIM